jgi:hypothetical protein
MMQQNMMNMNQNSTNAFVINSPQPIYGEMSYNPQIYDQSGQPYRGNMPYGQPINPYAQPINPYAKGF